MPPPNAANRKRAPLKTFRTHPTRDHTSEDFPLEGRGLRARTRPALGREVPRSPQLTPLGQPPAADGS